MKKIIIFLLFLLAFSSITYAVSPFIQTSTGGLQIEPINIRSIEKEKNIILNWHVFNSTNQILTNGTTSCLIHLYDLNGSHILENKSRYLSDDFYINFNTNGYQDGIYSYLIYCNNSKEAGFISSNLEISTTGKESNPLFLLSLIVGVFLISFILVYFSSMLAEEHTILILLCRFAALFILLYIPKLMLDLFKIKTTTGIYIAYIWFLGVFATYLFLYYFVYVPMVKWNWIKPLGGKKQ